uniref:Putative conserved secreted protein n=1 Tax=Ixodes ricinus TaxID=34613 RepID=A0A147BJM5_IXORI
MSSAGRQKSVLSAMASASTSAASGDALPSPRGRVSKRKASCGSRSWPPSAIPAKKSKRGSVTLRQSPRLKARIPEAKPEGSTTRKTTTGKAKKQTLENSTSKTRKSSPGKSGKAAAGSEPAAPKRKA